MSLKRVQGVGAMDMYKQNAVCNVFENQNVCQTRAKNPLNIISHICFSALEYRSKIK